METGKFCASPENSAFCRKLWLPLMTIYGPRTDSISLRILLLFTFFFSLLGLPKALLFQIRLGWKLADWILQKICYRL